MTTTYEEWTAAEEPATVTVDDHGVEIGRVWYVSVVATATD